MKILFTLILMMTLHSCSTIGHSGIELKITNMSRNQITGVVFRTSEKVDSIFFDRIVPGETAATYLSMKNNKLDGSYFLSFGRSNGTVASYESGYYSNGNPLDLWADVVVMDDTTLIEFKVKK